MNKVEVNSHGVNKSIKYNLLSEEKMREIGFHKNYHEGTDHEKYSPYWYFMKWIQFPKEKKWKDTDITFSVHIPKDNSDLDIWILDDYLGQHYPYQQILEKYPDHECASIVKEQVEEWMKYLQDNGVLSGHEYGDYI